MDCNKIYNHEAAVHKQFVKTLLVPEGNRCDLPKVRRKFNEAWTDIIVKNLQGPLIQPRSFSLQMNRV